MIHVTNQRTITLGRWPTEPDGRGGIGPRSAYVDHFWLPLLGPDATCVARLLTRLMAGEVDTVPVAISELAASLGLGDGAVVRLDAALDRLEAAAIVAAGPHGLVLVRPELPYLGTDQVARLPARLRAVHQASYALRADAPLRGEATSLLSSARLLSLAATVDEVLTDTDLRPGQLAYRFQHVVRLAEEARDEAVLAWAGDDLSPPLGEGQAVAQAMSEAVWAAHYTVASSGQLPSVCRLALADAAAGIIDWVVAEFPDGPTGLGELDAGR